VRGRRFNRELKVAFGTRNSMNCTSVMNTFSFRVRSNGWAGLAFRFTCIWATRSGLMPMTPISVSPSAAPAAAARFSVAAPSSMIAFGFSSVVDPASTFRETGA